ncbi:ATP synthase subunit C lysine N-methyltransferase [Toxorhynchites rutilus septentrionalis]|uniref:ATP synthase subunit C lysine N-methyltransferase n=1 Tax=Toxorhynchites rutilus septentrionalis TaxID=329112 RepID=UPI00247AE1F8|nr:ATP synthase subunit C lysine N-methyltransferase [Toxorhynchites rutilus septentrionalis]
MSINELDNLGTEQLHKNVSNSSSTNKLAGKILVALTGSVAVGLSIVCYPFVSPALRKHCLPYVPATTKQIENVLRSVKSSANTTNRLLDIGSGDGRIVIAVAKAQRIEAHGVELNPWLVYYSKLAALRGGVYGRTKFYRKDLWRFDISQYNNIVIFGVEQMMADLERKLKAEAQNDTTIIACRFPFPTMHPDKMIEDGINTVWTYRISK